MIPKPHNFARKFPPAGVLGRGWPRGALLLCVIAALCMAAVNSASAQYRPDIEDMGKPTAEPNAHIVLKPNAQIPLDLAFTNSDGKPVKVGDFFNRGRPVILSLVYFSCPNLCGITQDSLIAFVRASPEGIALGKDYDILVVSIDPDDTPAEAAVKRKNYLAKVPLPESQAGFIYLTGAEANIKTLADAVGFPFHGNPANTDSNKFAHDSGIFICTPDGHLSQTILGVTYEPETVHYRLRQASGGKIGGTFLGVCLSCGAIWFNPKTGHYENNPWFYAGTATGVVSIGFMAVFLTMLFKSDNKRNKLPPEDSPPV